MEILWDCNSPPQWIQRIMWQLGTGVTPQKGTMTKHCCNHLTMHAKCSMHWATTQTPAVTWDVRFRALHIQILYLGQAGLWQCSLLHTQLGIVCDDLRCAPRNFSSFFLVFFFWTHLPLADHITLDKLTKELRAVRDDTPLCLTASMYTKIWWK